jgi:hypothetical protein
MALKCVVMIRPRQVTYEADIWVLEGVTLYPLQCKKLRSCLFCGVYICLSNFLHYSPISPLFYYLPDLFDSF